MSITQWITISFPTTQADQKINESLQWEHKHNFAFCFILLNCNCKTVFLNGNNLQNLVLILWISEFTANWPKCWQKWNAHLYMYKAEISCALKFMNTETCILSLTMVTLHYILTNMVEKVNLCCKGRGPSQHLS